MGAAVRTEYRKVVTTRLWWILLGAMAVYMAFLAGVMAWALVAGNATTTGPDGTEQDLVLTSEAIVRTVYTIAVSFGYVFPLVVGALSVSSEYRHQTITPTFLAEPRRTVVLLAKVVVGAVLGVLFGLVGTGAAVAAGAGVLGALGEPTMLDLASTWRTLALSVLALAVWSLLGVAFGLVLTNQVAVVVVLLAFTQFVEPVLRFVLAVTSWGGSVAAYLPGAAGEAISGGSFYSETGLSELLPWWQGLLVLLGYALVLALIGRWTTFRRDVT
ncbi:ABC transporter permease [Cellulomonas soli]|uniref:ABC transporter permease n=1 Tax=Cellulomonas soli TaxID=931535 RepID=UPI003F835460